MMRTAALVLSAVAGMVHGLASTDTITWGGDNSRAGYQTNHNMNPAIVASSQFDQLFRTALPGNYKGFKEQIFSQPLVYTPDGGEDQFVYLATTQNNIYKLEAQTGEIVASRSLHIPFLTADLDGCVDINPTIGVIATGVIDPATETWYLAAKTYLDQDGGEGPQGRPAGRYYLHAIDVRDLSERENYPIDLEGTVARNNPTRVFNGGIHLQRPALLHQGQYIYAGFGSHCVQYNFTGWVIGWDKTSGELVERFATQGDGVPNDVEGAGIWMSGGGLASDDAGSVFFATGNGYASQLHTIPVHGFNPPTALEQAAVHMSMNEDGSLDVVDFFMPHEKQALDGADKDLGTSPLQILPSEFSCGEYTRIGVVTGKSGKTYWLNLDDLGGYRNGADGLDDVIQVYQNENSVYAGAGVYPLEGGYIYINVIQYPTHVFKFSCNNGQPSFAKVADTPNNNAYILGVSHGTVTSLNGEPGTGLLWTTDVQGQNLRIYDAVPQDGELVMIKSFQVPGTTKFTRAVFGDGIMYMGTTQGYVYGFGAPTTAPLNCTGDFSFGNVDVSGDSEPQTITCTALIGVTVSGAGLNDGTHYALADLPSFPLELAAGERFTFDAVFSPKRVGLVSESVVVNTTNGVEGYSISTSVRLSGTGESSSALLSISPSRITFSGIVTDDEPNGIVENILLNNQGQSSLDVNQVLYSVESADGPFEAWSGEGALDVGKFNVRNLPEAVGASSSVTLPVRFDSTSSGTFSGFLKFVTSGGNGTVSIQGTAGPAPVALVEFQTPDGEDWVKISDAPFTFGNVTQNTARSLRMRVTNSAPEGAVRLSLTVSKPPFGVSSIIRAANQVDLAEGTLLAPGQSASAILTCSVPKSQWNVDPYNGTATWTMNTNDPEFNKNIISFFCNAVSEQAPPLTRPGEGQYRYIGCFKENNPNRQLQSQLYGNDDNTNAMCIDACAGRDWIFCGTQYHRECWAGNKIPTLRVPDINCNFACAGDLNQICGGNGEGEGAGGAYFSLFADSLQWDGNYTNPNPEDPDDPDEPSPGGPVENPGVDGYASLGCYTEATTGRALPFGKNLDSTTVARCIAACAEDGYTHAGLQYSRECWCGNQLGVGAVSAPADDCHLTCQGNSTEFCGGYSRLNVYRLGGTPPPSNSTTSSTTSSPSTSTSNSPAPTSTSPSVKQRVGDWGLEGCYTETNNGRALSGATLADDDMTLEACAEFCDDFSLFGVEYGRECYCGNSLREGSVRAANQADCSFPCPGDRTSFCGAGNRLQLYRKEAAAPTSASTTEKTPETVTATPRPTSSASDAATTVSTPSTEETSPATDSTTSTSTSSSSSAQPTSTGPAVYPGNSNFTYYSCVSEPSAGRLLGDQVFNDGDGMTVRACLERCWDFAYAGVEYGRECWCGDRLNLAGNAGATPGKNETDSRCWFLCPGDDGVYCGAGGMMSLYVRRDLEEELS